jgi:hypothetical protein
MLKLTTIDLDEASFEGVDKRLCGLPRKLATESTKLAERCSRDGEILL